MSETAEIQIYQIDFDSPHRLGERPEKELGKPKWLATDGDTYSLCQATKVITKLPDGMYNVFQSQQGGMHAAKVYPETDTLYHLPNPLIKQLVEEIAGFWEKADEFKNHEIKHKRGILLHGGPGVGKTSTINLLASALINNGGLVFSASNINELLWFAEFANRHLRVVEPTRPVILILEDLDKMMDGGNAESMLLNFLDGELSVNHLVVVATSNRYDNLNDLVLRPSRFDTHVKMESPTEEVRQAYLIRKGLTEEDAKEWAKITPEFSLAELKEVFISVKLLGFSLQVAKDRVKKQSTDVKNTTFKKKDSKGIGFTFSDKK